jgi:serine/threonine-protein kinase
MADVYLAEQQSLGRQVAVKVLRRETMRHPAAVERFSQEARAAAALVHGNIVQIHEVACVEGIYFIAAEYVAGPSLKAWLLARGPLDPFQALSVLSQVGSALVKSAQAGIVLESSISARQRG